jgi:hypothetical protein
MSDDALDREIPPIEDDRTRLYLGARTPRGVTVVTYYDLRLGGADGLLPVPELGTPNRHGPFDWGEGRPGNLLAVALLSDACGPVAASRLWHEFANVVVRWLGHDEWELTAGRIQTWVTRRLAES